MSAKLQIPRPLGNQPRRPPDDPLAELVAASGDRYACPFNRTPPVPCFLGAHSGCAWGAQTEEDLYCMWVFIGNHPHGAYEKDVARALGMSRERLRQWIERALAKLTAHLRSGGEGDYDPDIAAALSELKELHRAA